MNEIKKASSRGLGKLFTIDNLNDGIGSRISREFLKKVFKRFVKTADNYFKISNDRLYAYSEKQIHSILFPALYEISKFVFLEQPIKRINKSNDKESHGWIDYWVLYKNTDFIIEVKHSWEAVKSNNIRNDTSNDWEDAIKQINRISRKDIKQNLQIGKNVVKLVLHIIPTYSESKLKNNLSNINKENSIKKFKEISSKLNPNPKWLSIWVFNDRSNKPVEFKNKKGKLDRYVSYYSLMFIAYTKTLK